MIILLTRDKFRESVFKRDEYKCVVCKNPATEVHHLLDRKLFSDGGYYESNGVSLDNQCHVKAENCEISVEDLRKLAGITEIVLPEGFDKNIIYDKWGISEDYNSKYPRTLHAQISLGTTSDDRIMPNGYMDVFSKMDLIITEKLDGQNLCFNKDGVYARSHVSPTEHAWDKPMIELWNLIKHDLGKGELELFGESMYAIHSIEYSKLENYFYLFGVRENGKWLSWEEVKFYASLFDFPTVPEIKSNKPLSDFYANSDDENFDLRRWLHYVLGMSWQEYVETPGQLGGFDPKTNRPCCEGFVVRNSKSFIVNEGLLPVMNNEFDSLFKIVRQKHVKTDEHWTKNWKRAKLIWEQNKNNIIT